VERGVALLENVFVNQHGDVFNDTHHFYFGACTPPQEAREPARLFAKVRTGLSAFAIPTGKDLAFISICAPCKCVAEWKASARHL